MATLEELTRGSQVRGILPGSTVSIVDVQWFGSSALELTYKDSTGRLANELLYRDDELRLEIAATGRLWSFNADGAMLRLVSEAYRIHLAYLFDPLLAVHTSLIDPLPHQITGVYEEMLKRQPLRFLLADDPGLGKTISAGLLIKELLIRGDLKQCLIVCPGSLVEQWQDELFRRFHLPFEILTNDKLEAARTGNWFTENPLAICRLDKLSRDEDVQAKLEQMDYDLIVCDEAHKMSATYFGGEVKYTKRYHLGQLLSRLTRHFLLMSATPHNGKEADFQLFLALLDGDRFEGKYRDGVHVTDAADMMRRMIKEKAVKFDGTPLFPERRAYTVDYTLSRPEAALYKEVTDYVREEFNRADNLEAGGRRGTVGFALTSLQRRLASSPEAIYQSLRRRREKLAARLREEQLLKRTAALSDDSFPSRFGRGGEERAGVGAGVGYFLTDEDMEDLEDAPDAEHEEAEAQVLDQATASQTIAELQAEIATLTRLEQLASKVRESGQDAKWQEVSNLLHDNKEMFDVNGHRRKLLIFTEYRDTLNYLVDRIRRALGQEEAVVAIHGGMGREDRRKAQGAFTQDKDVMVLVATDAAGEGINLRRAHIMANYDLPWNPNRLEQRFGRIHRIGQTEVCHCWNIVASETREGAVYDLLLEKLEQERLALGGQVFDVLGKLTFDNRPLRELLIEAIRYGDQPEVRARLSLVVDQALDRNHLRDLLDEHALAHDAISVTHLAQIREDMERAEARRLQPHYIASFFLKAFRELGGTIYEREADRYEITRVPSAVRTRDRAIGVGDPISPRYERITFEKSLISVAGKPLASFVCPGHPLLDATIDLLRERHRDLLKQGAVLVDDNDVGREPRALFYLEHAIQDASMERGGSRRVISRRLQFVETDRGGNSRLAGYAPYLDYRPLNEEERPLVESALRDLWDTDTLERQVLDHAVQNLVPEHLSEVRSRREVYLHKTATAVKERLTKEIIHWNHRALTLQEQEEAGKVSSLNSSKARQRADELTDRLSRRMTEIEQERKVSPLPPVIIGGALVIPAGLLAALGAQRAGVGAPPAPEADARETARIELIAMNAVMEEERRLGHSPRDVSDQYVGYDIESLDGTTGHLRFIEVKGRIAGADTITVTRNEILTALNQPERFILAVVQVSENDAVTVSYISVPFHAEPDFGATSVNYRIRDLLGPSGGGGD